MKTNRLNLNAERWLVCSDGIHSELVEHWIASSKSESLAALRQRRGLIGLASLESLPDLVKAAGNRVHAGAVHAPLHVVLPTLGQEQRAVAAELEGLEVPVRLHVWDRDPMAVIDSLFLPEEALLDTWRAEGQMPLLGRWGEDGTEATTLQYGVAIARWEFLAREQHDDLDAIYGPQLATLAVAEEVMGMAADEPLHEDASIRVSSSDEWFELIIDRATEDELASLMLSVDTRVPRLDEVVAIELRLQDGGVVRLDAPRWSEPIPFLQAGPADGLCVIAAFDRGLTDAQLQQVRAGPLQVVLFRERPPTAQE